MSLTLGGNHRTVLSAYPRAVVHMRKQIESKRFGLVFGSGLSKSFGLPEWAELVTKISKDPEIAAEKLLESLRKSSPRDSLPYQTELLYRHFLKQKYNNSKQEDHNTRQLDYSIMAEWRKILAKHLYAGAPDNLTEKVKNHPYLERYLPIIRSTHMTVTYNFDDFIEQALAVERPKDGKDMTRGYEMVTNPWTQFRRRDAIIYHPNGVIPQKIMEGPVDNIVFSEADYARQHIGAIAGDFTALLNHLSKNTCLFIGLSLEDDMLRNLLIQNARLNPGNYHYYIYFLKRDDSLDEDCRNAVSLTNFNVYNLVTMFLTEEEIAVLGDLLNRDLFNDNEFCDYAKANRVRTAYRYYITGPLGVGKTTASNNFRNFVVLDEWLEPRPEVLAKDWEQLEDDKTEKEMADSWIANQFKLKNDSLRHGKLGIYLVDRPPLDPLAFTPPSEYSAKAVRLLSTISPGDVGDVEAGVVILLTGDTNELSLRLLLMGRSAYTADKLKIMENALCKLYKLDGVISIDTRNMTVPEVVKRIANVIHLEEYRECNLHTRLAQIAKGDNV